MNRTAARNWITRYLAESLGHKDGLAAALPLTRRQVVEEDPASGPELSRHPDWALTRNGPGSVILIWLDSDEEEIIEIGPFPR